MLLRHGNRGSVSAMVVDRSGERLMSGGTDCFVKFWDFNSISDANSAIRTLEPCEAHVIRDLSSSGDLVLVVSASAQAQLISRDGRAVSECIKGDQYLVDMSKTKGHVSSLNGGMFNPFDQDEFLTCGDDGTARLWDVEKSKLEHKSIIKARGFRKGAKCAMTACGYSHNAGVIITGTEDGSFNLWDKRKPFVAPCSKHPGAHQFAVINVGTSYDDNIIITRCFERVLLWDRRTSQKDPLKSLIVPIQKRADFCVSPDDTRILIAASKGNLVVVNRSTLEEEVINICGDGADLTRMVFHPRLYQIFCGRSDCWINVHFDPEQSTKGATMGYRTIKKNKHDKGFFANEPIINPLALPTFRQEKIRNLFSHRVHERNSEATKRRPEMPISGAGEGGRIGRHGGTLSSYIVKNIALQHVSDTKEDPREALLKYAEKAENEPFWITPAYKRTQPNPIFADSTEDQDAKKAKKSD